MRKGGWIGGIGAFPVVLTESSWMWISTWSCRGWEYLQSMSPRPDRESAIFAQYPSKINLNPRP
jgi:hypothetical protein